MALYGMFISLQSLYVIEGGYGDQTKPGSSSQIFYGSASKYAVS